MEIAFISARIAVDLDKSVSFVGPDRFLVFGVNAQFQLFNSYPHRMVNQTLKQCFCYPRPTVDKSQ